MYLNSSLRAKARVTKSSFLQIRNTGFSLYESEKDLERVTEAVTPILGEREDVNL
jgi:hypothetical protein